MIKTNLKIYLMKFKDLFKFTKNREKIIVNKMLREWYNILRQKIFKIINLK